METLTVEFKMFGVLVDETVVQVIIIITLVLGIITIGLLAHLLIFHIVISKYSMQASNFSVDVI